MRWALITVLLLISTNSVVAGIVGYGGVDFSMMSDRPQKEVYSIPEFYSKSEAEQWGADMKGVEPIRRALGHHMEDLQRCAHLVENDLNFPGRILRAGRLMTQHAYCQTAMDILKTYKENGKHHDSAMTIYKPYKLRPLKNAQDAIRLGNEVKWNDDVMISIRDVRSKLLELTVYNSSYTEDAERLRVRYLMLQWDWFGIALNIMQNFKDHGVEGADPAQVGSSLYASSIPINQQLRRINGNNSK